MACLVHKVAVPLLALLQIVSADFRLTILHTNDVHARFHQVRHDGSPCLLDDAQKNECFGGYARLVQIVRDLRKKYPNTLVLDAGDQYQGSLLFYRFGGILTTLFMTLVGYDVMALGNHEFDQGPKGLLPLLKSKNFQVVSANMDASQEPSISGFIEKSVVLKVGGEEVGIVGYITPDTANISSPGKVKFKGIVASITEEVAKLEKKNVTKIVALGHAGYNFDRNQVARIPGVDVVVGGHSHTFLFGPAQLPADYDSPEDPYPEIVERSDGTRALVVQAYKVGKYLGVLHVTFNATGHVTSWSGAPKLLNSLVGQDQIVLAKLAPLRETEVRERRTVVGETAVYLHGEGLMCRVGECNLGNLLTDAILYYHNSTFRYEEYPRVALMNGGGIMGSIPQGEITMADLINVQPFKNAVDAILIKGLYLLAALEHSVSSFPPCDTRPTENFLQISGMCVKYSLIKPAGRRVFSVHVPCNNCMSYEGCRPLSKSAIYRVFLPSFLTEGGGLYTWFKFNTLSSTRMGTLDTFVTRAYLKDISPVRYPHTEGRIQYVDNFEECFGGPKAGEVKTGDAIPALWILVIVFGISALLYFLFLFLVLLAKLRRKSSDNGDIEKKESGEERQDKTDRAPLYAENE